jgi:GAF domain-containing protein
LGIVCLRRTDESSDPFDAEDEALARHLSQHAALAISNAQLLEAQKREIDRRKRAEDQSQRFEALVEHSGDFIAMAALDGRVLFINQAGRRRVRAFFYHQGQRQGHGLGACHRVRRGRAKRRADLDFQPARTGRNIRRPPAAL